MFEFGDYGWMVWSVILALSAILNRFWMDGMVGGLACSAWSLFVLFGCSGAGPGLSFVIAFGLKPFRRRARGSMWMASVFCAAAEKWSGIVTDMHFPLHA